MKRIIEFELQDNSPKIETELDFKGEIIRADEEALNKEYGRGHTAGYNSGKLDGYADGWGVGYENGYDSGHFIGNEEGYAQGYSQGDSAGYSRGFSDGNSAGLADGYDAGYASGYPLGYNEGRETGYSEGYSEGQSIGMNLGYSEGLTDGYSRGFTEGALPFSLVTNYEYLFSETVFPEKYDLTVHLPSLIRRDKINGLCYMSKNLRSVKVIGNGQEKALDLSNSFREADTLEYIDLSEFNNKFSTIEYCFLLSPKLKSIYGALDFSECATANNWITSAFSLEEIRFVPETIKISLPCYSNSKLSADTIESIIDGLADLTGSTAQNVSFHSDIIAKLTPEQLDRITAKNWTYS